MRRIVVLLLGCGLALYVGVKIPENPIGVLLMLGAIGYTITLTVNVYALAWLFVATASSAFIVPGLPGRPFVWEVCALAAWPSLAVWLCFNWAKGALSREEKRMLFCLSLYAVTLVVTMVANGVGFRVFGGEQVGGRFYLQQILLVIVPVLMVLLPWSSKALLSAFIAGGVLTSSYVVSDLALLSNGSLANAVLFVTELPNDAINFYLGFEMGGLRRLQSMAFLSTGLLGVFLVMFPLRWLMSWRGCFMWPVLLAVLGLGMASGHREAIAQAVAVVAVLMALKKMYTPLRIMSLLVVAILAVASIYRFSRDLPEGMQRAVSFLPGIEVSALAHEDAQATVRDRLEVIQIAWADIPSYLWLGRGFGQSQALEDPRRFQEDGAYRLYQSGYLPNGLLALMIKTGLAGLVGGLGFLYFVTRIGLNGLRAAANRGEGEEDIFIRLAQYAWAKWIVVTVFFLFVHGNAETFLRNTMGYAALTLGCAHLALRRMIADTAERND